MEIQGRPLYAKERTWSAANSVSTKCHKQTTIGSGYSGMGLSLRSPVRGVSYCLVICEGDAKRRAIFQLSF